MTVYTLADLRASDFPALELSQDEITGAMVQGRTGYLTSRWLLTPEMADLVAWWQLILETRFRIRTAIISGYRSPQLQMELVEQGRTRTRRSQHNIGNAVDYTLQANIYSQSDILAGLLWTAWGRTWGGLFCVPDWNHIDGRILDRTLPGYDLRISRAVESIKGGRFRWKSAC